MQCRENRIARCTAATNTWSLQCSETQNIYARGHAMRACVFDKRIIVDRLDRREVAMRDPFRAGRTA